MITLLILFLILCAIFVLAILVGAIVAVGGIVAPIILGGAVLILIDVVVLKHLFKKKNK